MTPYLPGSLASLLAIVAACGSSDGPTGIKAGGGGGAAGASGGSGGAGPTAASSSSSSGAGGASASSASSGGAGGSSGATTSSSTTASSSTTSSSTTSSTASGAGGGGGSSSTAAASSSSTGASTTSTGGSTTTGGGSVCSPPWSDGFSGTDNAKATAIAVGPQGGVVVAGAFSGTVDLGDGPLTSQGAAANLFVASFDCGGALRWSKSFGVPTQSNDTAAAVAVDAAGDVIVVGQYEGTIDFGSGALTSQKTDGFIAKLDASGDGLWSKGFGDLKSQDLASGVAVDPLGNVLVTGYFEGTVDFGGGAIHGNGTDLFVLALDPGGTHLWSKGVGQPGGTPSIAVDPSGHVIVCGAAKGDLDFGDGQVLSGAALFVAQLDSLGTRLWSSGFGGAGTTATCNQVATDGAGNVLLTGSYVGALDFGGGQLPDLDAAAAWTGYVAKLSSAGVHVFSAGVGAGGASVGNGISADAAGNVLAVGAFDTAVTFGGSTLTSSGDDDVFLVKLAPTGALVWQQRFGDMAAQEGLGVAVGADGAPVVAGAYLGDANLGSGDLPAVTANGGAFVARLAP